MKKFLALLLAAALALSLFACGKQNDDGDKDGDDTSAVQPGDIALKTENFSITMAEASYIFFQNYNDFRYNNSESFDVYNIDSNKSLKEQVYHDDITWFDYFKDATVSYLEYILVFCEAARAEGMELTEDDYKTIDETVASWTDYADNYGYSEDELFSLYLGEDINAEVLHSYIEKETLAFKYYDKIIEAYNFTDEELSSFVEENRDRFYSINYIKYTFDEDSDDDAITHAAELAAITDPDAFVAYIDNHMNNVMEYDGGNITLDTCYVNYAAKNEYSEFSKWAFDGAAQNSTYTEKNDVDGKYTVYLLTSTPSLQEYRTRNIRYILENVSSHSSFAETQEYLNNLLNKWKEGEATEDSFAALAAQYSQDTATNLNGGLQTNIARSSTDMPKELINWLFADERAPGDTAVVKGEQKYIAVYYVGEDEIQWKYLARQGLTEKTYLEDYEKLSEVYPVTVDDDTVNGIKG